MTAVIEPPVATEAEATDISAKAEPATVVALIRHAEKASDGTDDPPLTEAGKARARCLVHELDGFGPTALWSTPYTRTRQTLAPLHEATGLEVVEHDAADMSGWVQRLRGAQPGSRIVVAAHSNTIPAWVSALGGEPGPLDADGNIPHDEYDRIVFVVLDHHGDHLTTIVHRFC